MKRFCGRRLAQAGGQWLVVLLLCSCGIPLGPAHFPRAENDPDRLKAVFVIVQENYVVPIDMAPLAEAAIADIRKKSGIDEATWTQCMGSANSAVGFDAIRRALGCAHVAQMNDSAANDLTDAAIAAMIDSLNDQSVLIAPNELTENAKFGAIGLALTKDKDGVAVSYLGKGTPGSEAGIEMGDVITAIDGVPLKELTLPAVIALCRGAVGSNVVLTVKRGSGPAKKVAVMRRIVPADAMGQFVEMHGNVLVVQLHSIGERSTEILRPAIRDRLPATRAVVLDLRDNGGGLLEAAIELASNFLDEKADIGSTRGRNADDTAKYVARGGDVAPGVPLVVLVNEETAEGAELVASALQDNKRAFVVGRTTHAMDRVHTLFPLAGGYMLKLTSAYIYRATGRRLSDAPVVPDCTSDLRNAALLDYAIRIAERGAASCLHKSAATESGFR